MRLNAKTNGPSFDLSSMPSFIDFIIMLIKAFESNKHIRFEQQIVSKPVNIVSFD